MQSVLSRCWLLCGLLLLPLAAQAAVKAEVDRFNLSENETLNLTVTVTGDDRGEPDIAPLERDFDILSQNHSSSFSWVNGKSSSKSIWSYVLQPKRSGTLRIPPLTVGNHKTLAMVVQVSAVKPRASGQGMPVGDIWIDMRATPTHVKVQQQVVITIRIYQSVALGQGQVSSPSAKDAMVERLGKDSTYDTDANGRRWRVTEQHYALFPQKSGRLSIDPVQLDGSVMVGGGGFFQSSRPVRVRSNALTLQVDPMPAQWQEPYWLPAQSLRLREDWPAQTTFKVGEPITRTVTMEAAGALASQLPELPKEMPDHLKIYPDQPHLENHPAPDGMHGIRQEKVAIMPMQAGTYILPPIDIAWWNSATGQREVASLPARSFTVVASAVASKPSSTAMTAQRRPKSAVVPDEQSSPEHAALAGVTHPHGAQGRGWKYLAIVAVLGWLLTLLYLLWLRRQMQQMRAASADGRPVARPDLSLERLERQLRDACAADDAKGAERALLAIAMVRLPDLSHYALASIAPHCAAELKQALLRLERVLYGADSEPWRGEALFSAYQAGGFRAADAQRQTEAALPGLYPADG